MHKGRLGSDAHDEEWVDEVLLVGPDDQICLTLGEGLTRAELRRQVTRREEALRAAGLRAGAPPGAAAAAVAGLRREPAGRLADRRPGRAAGPPAHPVRGRTALERLAPAVVVIARPAAGGGLRAYFDVDRDGRRPAPGAARRPPTTRWSSSAPARPARRR